MRVLIFALLFVALSGCSDKSKDSSTKRYSITVTELDKPMQFNIPLQQDGWYTACLSVIKNTADDSVRIGAYLIIPPGKTGLLYKHEEVGIKPFTYEYVPYKAKKGKVVIEWSIKAD